MNINHHLYMLDKNKRIITANSVEEWGAWMELKERIVGRTKIGNSEVSTVFLGLNHSYGSRQPILWETMVFGGKLDQQQIRCSGSWEQAESMHQHMVNKVKESEKL